MRELALAYTACFNPLVAGSDSNTQPRGYEAICALVYHHPSRLKLITLLTFFFPIFAGF